MKQMSFFWTEWVGRVFQFIVEKCNQENIIYDVFRENYQGQWRIGVIPCEKISSHLQHDNDDEKNQTVISSQFGESRTSLRTPKTPSHNSERTFIV